MRSDLLIVTFALCIAESARGGMLLTTYIRSLQQQESVLAQVDPQTGAINEIGLTGAKVISSLAYDSSSAILYGVGRRETDEVPVLLRIDIETGATAEVGETGYDHISGMAYDASTDTLYASGWNGDFAGGSALYEVNRSTGQLSAIGEALLTPYGMTWDMERDRLLFSSATIPSQFGMYDRSSGAQAVISTFESFRLAGIAYASDADTIFAISGDDGDAESRLFRIDPDSGSETLVATLSEQQRYGSLVSVPIPAPGPLLLVAGALVHGSFRRRR